jgi:signal transduction histidine kinase
LIARSLRWRLLAAAAAAILLALAIAWAFMTLLFERHLERRLQEDMTRDALGLVASLALDERGMPHLAQQLGDPRLRTPAGGYYWQVSTAAGMLRSRSLWDSTLIIPVDIPEHGWRLVQRDGPFGQRLRVLERRLVLESDRPSVRVQFAQNAAPLTAARAEFGRELALFLAGLWCVLVAAAWLQVRVGLHPLARIRGELAALAQHANVRLPPANLREVQPLVDAINALADARQQDLQQARRRAADLAHGLKTPLAALAAQSRRARDAGAAAAADGMDRAVAAIGLVVEGELARTRAQRMGEISGACTPLRDAVERVVNVLEHTEKGEKLVFGIEIPVGLSLPVEQEHLAELLGALLENAARHARRRVDISASAGPGWTRLAIDDDGAGMPDSQREAFNARGARVDESGAAGLGLLIARDLARLGGAALQLEPSSLGGLRAAVCWAGHVPQPPSAAGTGA